MQIDLTTLNPVHCLAVGKYPALAANVLALDAHPESKAIYKDAQ